jgi:hypothetical protein
VSVTHAVIASNSKSTGTLFAGIDISNGTLTISRSQIVSNRGGGITVGSNGKFVIVGNMFLSNGDINGPAGGVLLSTSATGNRLEFNTIVDNKTQSGVAPGIQCTANAGFTAQNNIVWNNNPPAVQVGGGCLHAYSDIGTVPIPPVAPPAGLDAGNNHNDNPLFVGATNLEVTSTSPISGKANSNADIGGIAAKDIKGTARVLRAGAGADLGAYVVPGQ